MTTDDTDDPLEQDAEDEFALAELHYTDFGSAKAFADLVARHGLQYIGTTNHYPATPFLWRNADTDTLLAVGCHPVTGELHNGTYREEGYASYIKVAGPVATVEPLYRDVLDTAHDIKAEFKPLTAPDGRVIAEYTEEGANI